MPLEIRGSEEGRDSLPEERERDKADRIASAREEAAGSWRRFPATLQAVLALASKFVSKSKRQDLIRGSRVKDVDLRCALTSSCSLWNRSFFLSASWIFS